MAIGRKLNAVVFGEAEMIAAGLPVALLLHEWPVHEWLGLFRSCPATELGADQGRRAAKHPKLTALLKSRRGMVPLRHRMPRFAFSYPWGKGTGG